MNNVSNIVHFPTQNVQLHTVDVGSVFSVVAPKREGKDGRVKNDSIYRKEADSHCIQLSNQKVCIFDRHTLVRVIPKSRFANEARAATG